MSGAQDADPVAGDDHPGGSMTATLTPTPTHRHSPRATVPVVRFTVKGEAHPQVTGPTVGEPGRLYTIVYDGACRVCKGIVRRLEKWDNHGVFWIVPSQAPGVHARFPWIPARSFAQSVQLIRRDGHTWQGAAAIEQIIDQLPKGKLITWVFSIPFVRPLAERFYRWFARNRYRLGCGEHCQFRQLDLDFESDPARS
jgi:predicted DCC family thiol-disulfide oxidoreductase YuxK